MFRKFTTCIFFVHLIFRFYQVNCIDSKVPDVKEILKSFVRVYGLYRNKQTAEDCVKQISAVEDFRQSLEANFKETKIQLHDMKNIRFNVAADYRVNKFENSIGNINERYIDVLNCQKYNKESICGETFANDVLNKNNGVIADIRYIHRDLVGLDENSFVYLLKKLYWENYECSTVSQQQYFFNLYILLLAFEVKSRSIILFAYEILQKSQKMSKEIEIQLLHTESSARINKTTEVFVPLMKASSSILRRCDLQKEHVLEKTYTKLEGVFEEILFTLPMHLSHKYEQFDCSNFPSIINNEKPNTYNKDQRSCSNVVNCVEPEQLHFCTNKDQSKGPRYLFVNLWDSYNSDTMKNNSCSYIYRSTILNKKICKCKCFEPKNSDRYFSSEEVRSDIVSNKVITGVQLVKSHNVVSIQIQEGTLMPYGFIDQRNVTWKPVTSSRFATKESYIKLDWNETRGIVCQIAKKRTYNHRYVITGIKLHAAPIKIGKDVKHYLEILVETRDYDFKTGQLDSDLVEWHGAPTWLDKSHVYEFSNVDAPTNVEKIHKPGFIKKPLIHFTATSLLSKDIGSSVIPYLDIQPVYSKKAAPLTAIGFEHLGAEGSGGYLALTTETFDLYKSRSYSQLWKFNGGGRSY